MGLLDDSLTWSFRRLLTPLARLFLQHGYSYQDFIIVARQAFVDAGIADLVARGESLSHSRISVRTGVNRNDVARVARRIDTPPDQGYNFLARVLGNWQILPAFRSSSTGGRPLPCVGNGCDFHELVNSVSKHLHFKTTLAELEHAGAVEVIDGVAHLRSREYPRGRTTDRALELLASDIECLSRAVHENLTVRESHNLHLHTSYDNIFQADVAGVRHWLEKAGGSFHRRIREFLSKRDADVATSKRRSASPAGMKVTVTSFSYIEPADGKPGSSHGG